MRAVSNISVVSYPAPQTKQVDEASSLRAKLAFIRERMSLRMTHVLRGLGVAVQVKICKIAWIC